jgi:hypothetical protein
MLEFLIVLFHRDSMSQRGNIISAMVVCYTTFQVLIRIGYGLTNKILTPFRKVRYHLKEWSQSQDGRPKTPRELFNLRHATLRNVIERRFGTWKKQFKILKHGSEYPENIFVRIITALAIVNNYILDDGDEIVSDDQSDEDEDDTDARDRRRQSEEDDLLIPEADYETANAFRERLAEEMYADYEAYLRSR